MKIAICDDQKESLDIIEVLLRKIKRAEYIKKYTDINHILIDMEGGERFDIIIMDIDWNQKKNGIDYAAEISSSYPEIKIIFLTGYNARYSQNIFLKASNLSGYIAKPVDPQILESNIEKVWLQKQEEDAKKLIITNRNRPLALRCRDIVYVESKGHKSIIHTRKEEFICYEKLSQLQKRMESYFLCCHKSYLVNMEEISRIERNKVVFFDGREAQVSKNRYDETRRLYFQYLGKALMTDIYQPEE